jgi:YhcH/YjgK/YiaL family protein
MVTDLLTNAHLYASLGPRIARGLRFLAETDLKGLAAGRHDIDGEAVFALVSDYPPKPLSLGKWEAHRRYLDLQYVASGIERFGVTPTDRLLAGDYIPEKDITWLSGSGDFITLAAGQFIIVWPGDAHMPGLDAGIPGQVRKVVVKIAIGASLP